MERNFQPKYVNIFENKGKRIWVRRDIEGDQENYLASEHCLEKEYRTPLAIDYDDPKFDEDFYAHTIDLWYYYGGIFKGSGTLYDLSNNN